MSAVSNAEQRRFKTGLLTLIGGVLMIVWAWGLWIYRSTAPKARFVEEMADEGQPAVNSSAPASALAQLLIVALILAIVVLVGTLVIKRSWRRFLTDGRSGKTTGASHAGDAWSMHKLPDDRLADDDVQASPRKL
ncbi:MAG: hypothetical protein ACYTHJ_02675 [Planctomycetota bacterium]|jgi:hypothetical protein